MIDQPEAIFLGLISSPKDNSGAPIKVPKKELPTICWKPLAPDAVKAFLIISRQLQILRDRNIDLGWVEFEQALGIVHWGRECSVDVYYQHTRGQSVRLITDGPEITEFLAKWESKKPKY